MLFFKSFGLLGLFMFLTCCQRLSKLQFEEKKKKKEKKKQKETRTVSLSDYTFDHKQYLMIME